MKPVSSNRRAADFRFAANFSAGRIDLGTNTPVPPGRRAERNVFADLSDEIRPPHSHRV